jgi:hypothetical protein
VDVNAVALLAIVAAAALAAGTAPAASAEIGYAGKCGPVLCVPPAPGWSSSIGPGVVAGRPAAWILVGNFSFSADAAAREGAPRVPRGKVLVSIGDFPIVAASDHWRPVERLTLPRPLTTKRLVSWRVRFAGRAVSLGVRFGSAPNARLRRLVEMSLAAVHRRS